MEGLHRISHKTPYPASTHLQRVAGDIMHGLSFQTYGRAMACIISVWKYRRHRSTSVWKTSVRHHSRKCSLIENKIVENKCITIGQLEQGLEISSGAIHSILTTQLGYRSILGEWVSPQPQRSSKTCTVNTAKKLLETYEECAPRRLAEVITGDETWVYYSTTYSKYKMRSWVKRDERPAQIPKPDFRKPKVMYTIFFNSGGIVLQLPCESGKTVNATFFTEKVLPNLKKNVKEVRPKGKMRGIKLLIDNASSYTAKLTKDFLEAEGLDLLPAPHTHQT